MSGEMQTIPARHGVATFVPKGRTIKIINTYGKQVVSTWAIGLGAPPEGEENEEEEYVKMEERENELKEEVQKGDDAKLGDEPGVTKEETTGNIKENEKEERENEGENKSIDAKQATAEDTKTDNQAEGDKHEGDKLEAEDPPEQAPESPSGAIPTSKNTKRTWSSYIPSIPYRSKTSNKASDTQAAQEEKPSKAQGEANSKKWSSYLPTGKGFSSYVPNIQMPDTQGVVSAFKSSNSWDPNKSYAEQLYDFSKTPVGAGTLAVASGSGTASSLYAAYSAYTKMAPYKNDQPPMEYLSLPHTRAATNRLVPAINDTLLTNLRNPLMTLIEDTSTGAHDTLTAACDANMYAVLGVDKPAEHGSCAENLVLALRELNEKAGLKGTKAVGADITVNIAPTPLHLFMNAPIQYGDSSGPKEGAGAKGASLKVEEPQCKKRSYVRFRAERDIVVVLSACPNELGSQNGGKCMAANFMVEEAEDDLPTSTSSSKAQKAETKKPSATRQSNDNEKKATGMPNLRGGSQKPAAVKKSAERVGNEEVSKAPAKAEPKKDDADAEAPLKSKQEVGPTKDVPRKDSLQTEEPPKPKKKPKKLERRTVTPKDEAS